MLLNLMKTRARVKAKIGYEPLARVFDLALEQAQSGKGSERHSDTTKAVNPGFMDQITCRLIRSEGHGYARGQAIKKIDEVKRLDSKEAKIRELLGAINYLAADILILNEEA